MKNLKVESFGPIEKADVNFGDLTLLIGPQASGKSIFLQLLKLILDKDYIVSTLQQYNYIVSKSPKNILEIYFGEGMSNVWKNDSIVKLDGKSYTRGFLVGGSKSTTEKLFYIPAQRILSISDGRPKNFMEFDLTTPYVLRQFSELLRLYMQNGMGKNTAIFPLDHMLKSPQRKSFDKSIFHGGKIIMDEQNGQKKLRMEIAGMSIPFMTWSAGQKEFMPFLLSIYCLIGPPTIVVKKETYKYVVIEEPEMGLHPQAIISVIVQILELLTRGYKVIISTHSPVFLEFAWAFNLLKQSGHKNTLHQLFDLNIDNKTKKIYEDILGNKTINTYYFSRNNKGVEVKNISSLDANSSDEDISEWGGISAFASKTGDIVSKYIAD